MPTGERSQRQLRVGEEVRHALARLLRPGELRDPALSDANVTVTEVRLSPDLRNATAFVMPLGGANAADILAGLRRSAPYSRASLGKLVRLRRVPQSDLRARQRVRHADRIATVLRSETVARDLRDEDA